MDKIRQQRIQHNQMAVSGIVTFLFEDHEELWPEWFIKLDDGRIVQYEDEKQFRMFWHPVGKSWFVNTGDPLPKVEYDEKEEARISERESLEEEEYQEKICEYVIRSQENMERYGCWEKPSTKFRNKKPRTI